MYIDRRLAGVQAVQTLSRLNRAYKDGDIRKEVTYVIDFSDSSAEVLDAFSQYYGRAELEAVTDPNLIFDLKSKLDAQGHYDEYEIDRVVAVELDPDMGKADLDRAIGPVAQRLLDQHTAARKQLKAALDGGDDVAAKDAREEMAQLEMFRGDMQAYQRLYAFLSQIIDYGSTAVEKRARFFQRLIPLLKFGREREEVDLSEVRMTHHKLSSKGMRALTPAMNGPGLMPASATGTGSVKDAEKVLLDEVIAKLNELFDGSLSENDLLQWVFGTIRTKMEESEVLRGQARANTKGQFESSPSLDDELLNAVMDSHEANGAMTRQALDDDRVLRGILKLILEEGMLWERLRGVVG
jgi:type I restriction enzyme R subunit